MLSRSSCDNRSSGGAGCSEGASCTPIGFSFAFGGSAVVVARHAIGVTTACSAPRRILDDVLVITAAPLQTQDTLGFELPDDRNPGLLCRLHFADFDGA